ncbi:hypothetical protein [Candidatus Rhabdochlamydia sp. T3358]|uniref:hypothetical protein n=1 Tax=Candidatus Rhabdochlamydia sp. T3358 TaxID=2099795 RepID=UPI0010B299F4|nr:hypothetical protein [Candidatus Rhabdochlamydia sp. T3358]VHO00945.1 hypothetical protein RHT_00245 [Candidatus Rhabdochlamydia sp. T3358]
MDRTRNSSRNYLKPCYVLTIITIAICIWTSLVYGAAKDDANPVWNKDPLIQHIYWQVIKSIEHLEDLPGIKDVPKIAKSISILKPGLKKFWTRLVQEGFVIIEETDKVGRPYAVYLQAIIEDTLSSELQKGQLTSLKGVIHTPMPATPFCTEGKISKDLMVTTIEKDYLRLGTVLCRAIIAREYLSRGGQLDIIYPKYGKPRRLDQWKIYQETLKKYSVCLKDHPLDCISMNKDLVGAYYLFKDLKEKEFAFAISASQANDVPEKNIFGFWFNLRGKTVFGLWFDELKASTSIYKRISEVEKFIKERDFPLFYKHSS